jgi:hypothetical protein
LFLASAVVSRPQDFQVAARASAYSSGLTRRLMEQPPHLHMTGRLCELEDNPSNMMEWAAWEGSAE